MFPLVAGTREEERRDLAVIATPLLLVLLCGCVISLGAWLAPAWMWTSLLGSGFALPGRYDLPYLLTLYALAAILYSLSVVFITFEMSYKIANTSLIQLEFSGALIVAICIFHSSLREVILVQLILMATLFVSVAVPFVVELLARPRVPLQPSLPKPVRLIRRVSEDAVISEFLKSDFASPAYRDYRDTLQNLVMNPNLANASENAKRRVYSSSFSLERDSAGNRMVRDRSGFGGPRQHQNVSPRTVEESRERPLRRNPSCR
jgi:hypothetical protein